MTSRGIAGRTGEEDPPQDVLAERLDIDAAVQGRTIPDVYERLAARWPDAPSMRWRDARGQWREWTVTEARDRVRAATLGLLARGLGRGDFGLVMAANRPEHALADLALVHAGAASVTLYNTLAAEQIAWIAAHCGATVAIVETAEHRDKLRAVRHRLPRLHTVVLLDAEADPDRGELCWAELLQTPDDPAAFDRSWRQCRSQDLLSLIYTSGTTGEPKGVMYTHHNILWTAESMVRLWGTELLSGSRLLSYLPLAHVAERFTSHWAPLWQGLFVDAPVSVTFCPDLTQLLPSLLETRPTLFVGVPRVWEKFQAAVRAGLAAQPAPVRERLEAAMEPGRELARLRSAGRPVSAELAGAAAAAAGTVRGLLAQLGLDQCRLAVASTAPIPVDLELFWAGLDLPLAQVWGMSELTGPATAVPPGQIRAGTVGPAIPGTEVRLAPDGELLVRGGNVMAGYYRDPERTAQTVDAEGWLHSGDLGVAEAGWFRIVDRKKELIITSSGKNIAPAQIESQLKMHPLIGQAVAIGDNRNYVTALIVLDPETAAAWAAARGLPIGELPSHPELIAAVAAGVRAANAGLSRIEQVKRFALLAAEWTPQSGELTPTQKLRRRVVTERYGATIEGLYADPPVGHQVSPAAGVP